MKKTATLKISVGFLLHGCAIMAGRSTPWTAESLRTFAMRTVDGEKVFPDGLSLEQAGYLITLDPGTLIDFEPSRH